MKTGIWKYVGLPIYIMIAETGNNISKFVIFKNIIYGDPKKIL